ncbi:unnamed protein product [Cuscuta campestris]|uniref:FAS1 domain-containing protein n=1 Tax=Cuscuta campestris TaxID=132261 RepID=A0A484KDZ9_9ASTE|nr:unnamed protein product [Cuscuta campestris]
MADSCSHWWHAPFYVTLSIALAFVAISTGIHRSGGPEPTPVLSLLVHNESSFNASVALRRRGGFTVFAALLQISPDLFLSPPDSTVFAVHDSAFSNLSLPSWAIKHLLLYHTSPASLPFRSLLRHSPATCLSTLLRDRAVKITKIDQENGGVEINNVSITDPDLFLGPHLSVHGVAGFFSPVKLQGSDRREEIIESPSCDSDDPEIQWPRIVQSLSYNGFVSFAIGLHSVLDSIPINMSSVTIFAPPSFGFLDSPSPLLDRVVKLHLLPRIYSFEELSSLPNGSVLETLLPGAEIKIGVDDSTRSLAVNGVEITAPDVLRSRNFTVHGISRALGVFNHVLDQIA